MFKKVSIIMIIPLLIILLQIPANTQQPVTPESLALTVYVDGFLEIEYEVNIDPTYPTVNVTLFGHVYEELIVADENWSPLVYSVFDNVISINSLGAGFAKISYLTSDLTNKVGRYWNLNFSSPIVGVRIILPEEASIVSLNNFPESIQSSDGKTIIIMPKGQVDITYIIGIVGTKEYAELVIDDTEKAIEEIKGLGIIVTEAEQILSEAKDAFVIENYANAGELAKKAKALALKIQELFFQASGMILDAEKAIIKAEKEGRISNLEEAKSLLLESKIEFDSGNYTKALELASQAKISAENSPVLGLPDFFYIGIISTIIIAIIIILFLYIKYVRKKIPKYKKEISHVNVDKIFEKNTDLRFEDREVIEFLKEAGGELYESEIRGKFKLPRTSTWRLIKRLERNGIVDISKVGGQNLIKVKKEYCY